IGRGPESQPTRHVIVTGCGVHVSLYCCRVLEVSAITAAEDHIAQFVVGSHHGLRALGGALTAIEVEEPCFITSGEGIDGDAAIVGTGGHLERLPQSTQCGGMAKDHCTTRDAGSSYRREG